MEKGRPVIGRAKIIAAARPKQNTKVGSVVDQEDSF